MDVYRRYLQLALDIVFPPRSSEVLVRQAAVNDLVVAEQPAAPGVTALLHYKEPLVSALIAEAKFHRQQTAFALLGAALRAAPTSPDALFVPIPLSRQRLRTRGYNQVVEVLKAAETPFHLLLLRTRHTTPQMELSRRERLVNVADAFAVDATVAKLVPLDTPLVLLDDVTTTGATLKAAATALRAAGYTKVRSLALAH